MNGHDCGASPLEFDRQECSRSLSQLPLHDRRGLRRNRTCTDASLVFSQPMSYQAGIHAV